MQTPGEDEDRDVLNPGTSRRSHTAVSDGEFWKGCVQWCW